MCIYIYIYRETRRERYVWFSCIHVSLYISISLYMYIYVHMNTCSCYKTRMYIYTFMHMCIHMYVYMHICIYICTFIMTQQRCISYTYIYIYICWFLVCFCKQKTEESAGPQLQRTLCFLIAPGCRRLNNPTLWDFCVWMIGRADIEGSKSNVAMNAWLPQACYPCGNFSDTSARRFLRPRV